MNIPKQFIAGTVYDPEKKEVIIGATCTLTDTGNNEKHTEVTDGFGDFWFDKLKESTYLLKIEKNGKTKIIESISTGKYVNLGDITFQP